MRPFSDRQASNISRLTDLKALALIFLGELVQGQGRLRTGNGVGASAKATIRRRCGTDGSRIATPIPG